LPNIAVPRLSLYTLIVKPCPDCCQGAHWLTYGTRFCKSFLLFSLGFSEFRRRAFSFNFIAMILLDLKGKFMYMISLKKI
jgi:hypothetical protein